MGDRAIRGKKPTKLTPDVAKAICESVRRGNYLTTAAQKAGVHRNTVYLWLEKAQRGDGDPYESFAHQLEVAKAEAEAEAVEMIREAAYDDWKAAKFWLERALPQRWGEVVAKEGADDEQRPVIHVQVQDLEAAEQEERRRIHGGTDGETEE